MVTFRRSSSPEETVSLIFIRPHFLLPLTSFYLGTATSAFVPHSRNFWIISNNSRQRSKSQRSAAYCFMLTRLFSLSLTFLRKIIPLSLAALQRTRCRSPFNEIKFPIIQLNLHNGELVYLTQWTKVGRISLVLPIEPLKQKKVLRTNTTVWYFDWNAFIPECSW